MELKIETDVAGNYKFVLGQFNRDLFLALAPAFPKTQLIRFDGSYPGDKVEIKLQAGPISVTWSALITEQKTTDTEAWFTDVGQKLPFPLKTWQHRHLVTRLSENKSRITDHIFFSTGFWVSDQLCYLLLKNQFAKRVPIYKRWFAQF